MLVACSCPTRSSDGSWPWPPQPWSGCCCRARTHLRPSPPVETHRRAASATLAPRLVAYSRPACVAAAWRTYATEGPLELRTSRSPAHTLAPRLGQVHVDCLNEWRTQSVNPRSLYTCDACGYSYRIQRTAAAAWLQSEGCVENGLRRVTALGALGCSLGCVGLQRRCDSCAAFRPSRCVRLS